MRIPSQCFSVFSAFITSRWHNSSFRLAKLDCQEFGTRGASQRELSLCHVGGSYLIPPTFLPRHGRGHVLQKQYHPWQLRYPLLRAPLVEALPVPDTVKYVPLTLGGIGYVFDLLPLPVRTERSGQFASIYRNY